MNQLIDHLSQQLTYVYRSQAELEAMGCTQLHGPEIGEKTDVAWSLTHELFRCTDRSIWARKRI